MVTDNISTPYVRIDAVAKYFDVSTSTVRIWLSEGRIPTSAYIKSGRTYRFRLPEIEKALLGDDAQSAQEQEDAPTQMNLDFGNSAA